MQIGSSTNMVVQLTQALRTSAEQTSRHIQSVQADVQETKEKVLQNAIQQTATSAEIKGRIIDVTV